ncbi:MAG TPA: hypothetical protein VGB64_13125 [Actinomycetota bacterium]
MSKRKVTLAMEESVVYDLKQAVDAGLAKSQSRLVQDAVVNYLDEARRRALRDAYAAAAADPLFVADVDDLQNAFADSDDEDSAP